MTQLEEPSWPSAYAAVFEAAIEREMLDAMRHDAECAAKAPNFWVPKVRLCSNQGRHARHCTSREEHLQPPSHHPHTRAHTHTLARHE